MNLQKLELNEVRTEFDKILKDKLSEQQLLSARLQDLHDIYENRPSRSEDVEQLNILQQRLAEFEDALGEKEEELKYFKLELIKRETMLQNSALGNINPLN